MPGPVFLSGERVSLRPPGESDVAFLQHHHNDPGIRQLMPRVYPQSIDAIREEYVEGDDEAVRLLACSGDDADADRLGFCSLSDVDQDMGRAEVDVWFAQDVQGLGFAAEALELLIEYAFDELRLHRLEAATTGTNDRSQALFDRLAFVEEGRRRDYYYLGGDYVDRVEYGLLEPEWREGDPDDPK
ncbi:MAG: GNAT family N-acetyltransferase [Halobellus sp.]|uniref:GNAT family N-acetyltransferase n=1 Tax=Halobellus sp. TaxID=1979212 RepID=UPI0035D405B4